MKRNSTTAIIALLALILVLQIANLANAKEEVAVFEENPQPYPTYSLYGTMIDITPFIDDVESVNGINCTCVIYDGTLVKLP